MTRWAVTGAGLVAAAGSAPEAIFDAVAGGSSRAALRDGTNVACLPIEGFDPKAHLDRKGLGDLSRTSQLACAAAARLAPALAGIPPADVGVVLGTAWGSLRTVVAFERAAQVDGPRFVDPFLFAETVANVPAGQVAIVFGWSACNATVSSGRASGLAAICAAVDLLIEDRAKVVAAGGADELNPPLLLAWENEGRLARDPASLPLARGRSGPIAGEGACLLAIEADDHAAARGATPLAHVAAAARVSAIGGGGGPRRVVAELVRRLLRAADLPPDGIDLVVLSADGGRESDAEEALGVMEVFGKGDAAPPVVAPKGSIGETWGAAGSLAAVFAIEAMRRRTIPAPARETDLDPALEGLRIPRAAIRGAVRHALILDGAAGELIAGIILEQGGSDAA